MKRFLPLTALFILATPLLAGFAGALLEEKTIPAGDLRTILTDLKLKTEEEKDEEEKTFFMIETDDATVVMYQYGGEGDTASSVQLRAIMEADADDELLLPKLNAWNAVERYTKAYTDGEGGVMLEQDLDLAAGFDKGAIKKYVKDFMDALPKFQKMMEAE